MSKRHQYSGCDIKVGEWGTTVHGRDLRHAITKLNEYTQEKYRMPLQEYLGNSSNGKRIHRSPTRTLFAPRRNDVDPVISRIMRRRRA